MEKDIHVSHKGQGAATNREKGQGVTRTRAGAAPCKNGLARTLTIPVSTFTIDFVFENCFLSAMTPYVDSRDGQSLSIYGSECQIWKTFTTIFKAIDPNEDISKMRQVHVK